MQRTKGKERVISKTCSQQISPSKFRASQYTPLTVRLPKNMNSIRMNEDTTMRMPHRNGIKNLARITACKENSNHKSDSFQCPEPDSNRYRFPYRCLRPTRLPFRHRGISPVKNRCKVKQKTATGKGKRGKLPCRRLFCSFHYRRPLKTLYICP